MAGEGQVASTGSISLGDLAVLLGGNKTKQTSTANIDSLMALLSQVLKPADSTAQLNALFQQAGAQIPGLVAARSNAVGARTRGNSAIAGSMDKLQQDIVLRAQQQIAMQELQRQQIAAGAASQLAQVTRNTATQQGPNLGRAAGNLAILQGLSQLANSRLGKKTGDVVSEGLGNLQNAILGPDPAVTNYTTPGVGPATFNSNGANALAAFDTSSLGPIFQSNFQLDAPAAASVQSNTAVDPNNSNLDFSSFAGNVGTFTPEVDASWGDEFANIIGMKDGGLVGRDNKYADGGLAVGGARKGSTPVMPQFNIERALARFMNPLAEVPSDTPSTPAPDTSSPVSIGDNVGGATVGDSGTTAVGNGSLGQAANVGLNVAIGNPIGAISAAVNNPAVTAAINAIAALATQNPVTAINAVNSIANAVTSGVASNNVIGITPDGIASTIGATVNAPVDTDPATISAMQDVIAAMNTAIGSNVSGPTEGTVGDSSGNAVGTGDGGSVGTSGGSSSAGDGGVDGSPGGKHGGKVRGPGTGTSDSIHARLSDGEYVIPADVVQKLGVGFFDSLRSMLHTPAR